MQEIQTSLKNQENQIRWQQYCKDFHLDQTQIDNEVSTTNEMVKEFLFEIDLYGDTEEVYAACVNFYTELKLRWIRLNNQVQYSMLLLGTEDSQKIARAAILADLIALLEPHIQSTDQSNIVNSVYKNEEAETQISQSSEKFTTLEFYGYKIEVEGAKAISISRKKI